MKEIGGWINSMGLGRFITKINSQLKALTIIQILAMLMIFGHHTKENSIQIEDMGKEK